jgi:hypothetical protein
MARIAADALRRTTGADNHEIVVVFTWDVDHPKELRCPLSGDRVCGN